MSRLGVLQLLPELVDAGLVAAYGRGNHGIVTFIHFQLYDGQQEPYGLERIEILRGAASVLFGSAAPGGIVNTITKKPTDTPLHELNLEVGNYSRKQISADFGGPLTEGRALSYRLTGLMRDSDIFIDHVPENRIYNAPVLKW